MPVAVQLSEETQRLELQHQALDAKVDHFQKIVQQIDFIERAPTSTLSPLEHAVENLPALQESLQRMSSITALLEHDSAQFKRQRLDTRNSYRMYSRACVSPSSFSWWLATTGLNWQLTWLIRGTTGSMRDRFLARTNATKVVSNDDLKVLNAQLQSM